MNHNHDRPLWPAITSELPPIDFTRKIAEKTAVLFENMNIHRFPMF